MVIDSNNCKEYGILSEETKACKFIAAEMQKYIRLSCGFTLDRFTCQKYFISLGKTREAEKIIARYDLWALNEDGFIFVESDGNFYIFGSNDKAVIFGGYTFLERYLGIRFVNADCEYVPSQKRLCIADIEKIFIPYSGQRTYLAYGVQHDALMNLRYRFTSDYGMEYKELDLRSKWFDGIPFGHNSNYYVSKEKYGKSNPEFFSTHRYKNFREFESATELCYTNGITDEGDLDESREISVVKAAADSLISFIKKDDRAVYFMFGRLDNAEAICHCPRCEAARKRFGGDAGIMIVFLNALIREVRIRFAKKGETFQKKIVTFAYSSTIEPPVKDGKPISEKVIPDPVLYIRYAPIHADYSYSLSDPRQKEEVRRQLAGWTLLTKNIMVWDYNNNYNEYFWYFANLSYLKENMELYRRIGVSYIMKQGANNAKLIWFDEMRCYVCSKLFWNLSLSVESLVSEYCNLYYGPAGPIVFSLVYKFEKFFGEKIEQGFHICLGAESEFFAPENYPLNFLLDCEKMILDAIAHLQKMSLALSEKQTYLQRLKAVLMTPVRMIYKNRYFYFGKDDKGYESKFFTLADELGIKKSGEVVPIYIDFVTEGRSDYKIVIGQKATQEEMICSQYLSDKIFKLTGCRIPVVKDDHVFPAYWERAIMVGKTAMTKEFYKQGLDLSPYIYFIDVKGWCVFIDSDADLQKAVSAFLQKLLRHVGEGKDMQIIAKQELKTR